MSGVLESVVHDLLAPWIRTLEFAQIGHLADPPPVARAHRHPAL